MQHAQIVALASADSSGLEGRLSAHFGRCPYYTLVEIQAGEVTSTRVVENPHVTAHVPGTTPLFVKAQGAHVIIAGGMGPRAVQIFNHLRIEVVTGATGRVGEVLEAWRAGILKGIVPCNHDHPDSCGGHS